MYRVEKRYEYWHDKGKVFSKWFFSSKPSENKEELEKLIESMKKDSVNIKLKLKEEYRITEIKDEE